MQPQDKKEIHITKVSQINVKEQYKKTQTILPLVENQHETSMLKIIIKVNEDGSDFNNLDSFFLKHFLLQHLSHQKRTAIIKKMSLCCIAKGKILYSEGGIGHAFYIIKSGQVESFINGNAIQTYSEWEYFGDLALVHLASRKETIKATVDTFLWCLDHYILKDFLRTSNENEDNDRKKLINSIQLLSILNDSYKTMLAISMIEETYPKDTIILHGSREVTSIYFIKEGNVSIMKNNEEAIYLEKGNSFGDKQILIQSKSVSDIKSTSYVSLYSLSVNSMKQIISHTFRDYLFVNFIQYAFESSEIHIERSLIWKIYPCFKVKVYSKNDVVLKKGYIKNTALIIIIEGNLKNKQSNKYIPIQRGSILFNDNIFEEEVKGASHDNTLSVDLVADPDCLLLTCSVNEMEQITQMNFDQYIDKCRLISSFRRIPIFMHLSIEKIEQVSDKVSIEAFKKNDIIIKEGEEGSKFYVIKYGKADIYIKNRFLKTLTDYEYFGENNLLGNDKRTATVIVKSESIILYTITKNNFQKIINEENLLNYLNQQIISQEINIQLEDLDYINTLHDGIIDSVYLVQKKSDKKLFIIKCIKKAILNDYIYSIIENEKQILMQIDHPFITKLIKTLKDDQRLYFLMEFSGETRLCDIIKELVSFSKNDALFYIGSLLHCVQFLHLNSIIHRDIKPENIIIGNNGYIKLFNFKTAKIIKGKTMTVIGSPDYMSPEEIKGESYAFSADLWSIGVCLYELLTGCIPFGGSSNDPIEIYKSILLNDLCIPSSINDQECKLLLKSMLHKNILRRLCSIELIKSHSIFSNFDWEGLINLNMKPPYKPIANSGKRTVANPTSLIHFQGFSTLKYSKNEDKIGMQIDQTAKKKELDKWISSF